MSNRDTCLCGSKTFSVSLHRFTHAHVLTVSLTFVLSYNRSHQWLQWVKRYLDTDTSNFILLQNKRSQGEFQWLFEVQKYFSVVEIIA